MRGELYQQAVSLGLTRIFQREMNTAFARLFYSQQRWLAPSPE
jgi:hypothetical protein